ncbi:hypothetical protein SAMN06265373_1293 [Shimia sagamensis]|uniref:RiboL-PSP-HEPN domain-containing protein n=2 Tax=Shimia sagamensis TaxID=1566352 RepID=A0ABY1PRI9_9RHOB|nr:hypothetical protein SAMN06265373_1293 [Shimia sagamensis]
MSVTDISVLVQRLQNASLGTAAPNQATIVMAGCFIFAWSNYERLCLKGLGEILENNKKKTYQQCIEAFIGTTVQPNSDFSSFEKAYGHFRDRYAEGLGVTMHFGPMVGQDEAAAKAIKSVFISQPGATTEKLRALLLIAYRLRGNLVHGNKWTTGLSDQYENLHQATQVLLGVVEQFSPVSAEIKKSI